MKRTPLAIALSAMLLVSCADDRPRGAIDLAEDPPHENAVAPAAKPQPRQLLPPQVAKEVTLKSWYNYGDDKLITYQKVTIDCHDYIVLVRAKDGDFYPQSMTHSGSCGTCNSKWPR